MSQVFSPDWKLKHLKLCIKYYFNWTYLRLIEFKMSAQLHWHLKKPSSVTNWAPFWLNHYTTDINRECNFVWPNCNWFVFVAPVFGGHSCACTDRSRYASLVPVYIYSSYAFWCTCNFGAQRAAVLKSGLSNKCPHSRLSPQHAEQQCFMSCNTGKITRSQTRVTDKAYL